MKKLGARIPIVYFSKGEVTFKHDTLHYNALKEKNKLLKSYCSLDNDLSFVLDYSSIKSIGGAYMKENPWANLNGTG